jgi:hypothetical protein
VPEAPKLHRLSDAVPVSPVERQHRDGQQLKKGRQFATPFIVGPDTESTPPTHPVSRHAVPAIETGVQCEPVDDRGHFQGQKICQATQLRRRIVDQILIPKRHERYRGEGLGLFDQSVGKAPPQQASHRPSDQSRILARFHSPIGPFHHRKHNRARISDEVDAEHLGPALLHKKGATPGFPT